MPEDKLIYLGKCIRAARKDCRLTQQELADQCGLAIKTIQEIEKGRKNATYETLAQLIERLGISANTIFQSNLSLDTVNLQKFIGKFQSCTPENQKILLNTLDFLQNNCCFNNKTLKYLNEPVDKLLMSTGSFFTLHIQTIFLINFISIF